MPTTAFNLIFVSFHKKRVPRWRAESRTSERGLRKLGARCISNLVRAQKKRMRSPWKGKKAKRSKQASKQGTESVKRSGK